MHDYKAGSLLALTLTAVQSCITIWEAGQSVIQAIKYDIYCSQHKHAMCLLNAARCIINLTGWYTHKEQSTIRELILRMWNEVKNDRYSRQSASFVFPFELVQRGPFIICSSVVKVSTYGLQNVHLQRNRGGLWSALEKPADEFLNVNLWRTSRSALFSKMRGCQESAAG